MEWKIGEVAISGLVAVLLGLLYNSFKVESDAWKGWIAVFVGMAFGILFMVYKNLEFTASAIIEYLITGLQVGLTSVGMYRVAKRDWEEEF